MTLYVYHISTKFEGKEQTERNRARLPEGEPRKIPEVNRPYKLIVNNRPYSYCMGK